MRVDPECIVEPPSLDDPARWLDDHGDYLYSQACRAVGSGPDAEDLLQDTLLQAIRKRETFLGRGNVRAWLSAILRNRIIDHYRKRARQPDFTDLGEGDGVGVEFGNSRAGPGVFVLQAMEISLATLGESERRLFLMAEADGHEHHQLAEIFSISPGNVRVRLHRIRQKLRAGLALQGVKPAVTSHPGSSSLTRR